MEFVKKIINVKQKIVSNVQNQKIQKLNIVNYVKKDMY